MTSSAAPLLTDLLQAVSRSFYLTMRVLPGSIRRQIGLAYLLARATDTIADTEILPVAQRLEALRELRERILGTRTQPLDFSELAHSQGGQQVAPSASESAARASEDAKAERMLLERIEEAIGVMTSFSADDQGRMRGVLVVITGGQELDLQRFGSANREDIVALQTDAHLDDYTYRVAGCVGEFWTKMCRAHVFPGARLDDATLLRDGIRFGKGLQLVNILRDVPRDLRQGRCYLPLERLARARLTPRELLNRDKAAALRPVYDELLDAAEAHLAAGWSYTNALPRSAARVRLACAWPVLIGVKTLARLRRENPLDGDRRVKASRVEVRQILVATLLRYPFSGAWGDLFERARR